MNMMLISKSTGWRNKVDPWAAADIDDDVVYAVRAFKNGMASEGQQKLLWDHLNYMCGVGEQWQDLVYRPGAHGDRDTCFASGKQYPALQWRKLLRPEFNPKGKPVEGEGKKSRRRRAPRAE